MGMMLRRYHHKGTKGITTSTDLGTTGTAEAGSTKPDAKAAKTLWISYAEGLGLDGSGTVAQIQERVSAHETAQADLVKEGAEDAQEETQEEISEAADAGVDVSGPSEDEVAAQEAAGAPEPGATNPEVIGE